MDNLKRYQICHDLITYFATLISKKNQLDLIFRTGGIFRNFNLSGKRQLHLLFKIRESVKLHQILSLLLQFQYTPSGPKYKT